MKMELQLFSEEEAASVEDGAEVVEESKGEEIQARIEEAVSKAAAKMESRITEARKEQERLSKLSEDERVKAELESARQQLADKEAELKRREIEFETIKVLEQRGIPTQFVQYFISDDNETTLNRIKTFEKIYKASIESAVTAKLKGKAPVASQQGDEIKPSNSNFIEAIKKNQVIR